MGLEIGLLDALSGLQATQTQLQVISGNVANAQTPGYSEQEAIETSVQTPAGGSGVNTSVIQRVTDQLLSSNVTQQTTAAASASTTNNYLQQLQNLLGQVGSNNSFTDALNNFISAMQTDATTPDDTVAQSAAVDAGQQLAQQLNTFSSGIQSLRSNTDSDLATSITTVNTALQQIASLNSSIAALHAEGQSTATLEDERSTAVNQVAQMMGVTTFTRPNDTIVLTTTSGQPLVDGTSVSQFGYTQSGTVSAGTPLSAVTLNGVDVTSSLTTGTIGALLQLRNTTLPNVTAELNQFTNNLYAATTDSNLNTANSGTNATNDANHFFANVNIGTGLDNASTIEVNPSLVQNPTLLYDGTSGNDPTISSTIANNLSSNLTFAAAGNITTSTTTTLSAYGGQIIGQAATAAAAATQNNIYQSQLQSQMQSQLQSVTGVNLDKELANLTVYQNAYGASAHVIATIQSMFDSLMSIQSS